MEQNAIGLDPFSSFAGKIMDTSMNVGANVIQGDIMGRHADARQLAMMRRAPLAMMQGYKAAGINPFAAQSTPASSPQVTTPNSPIGAGNLTDYLATMSQVKLNESQVKRNDAQNEETKANVKLLEESAGLTHAEAVNAEAQLSVIRETADQLRASIDMIRAQTKTEGYKQRNLEESSNMIHEQTINARESRAEIIANGKIAQYNFKYILPLTSRKLQQDYKLGAQSYRRVEKEITKLANEICIGDMDITIAATTLANRLRKALSDSHREALESQMKANVTDATISDRDSGTEMIAFLRYGIQMLSTIMQDLSDCVPIGRALGIDKIGNSK